MPMSISKTNSKHNHTKQHRTKQNKPPYPSASFEEMLKNCTTSTSLDLMVWAALDPSNIALVRTSKGYMQQLPKAIKQNHWSLNAAPSKMFFIMITLWFRIEQYKWVAQTRLHLTFRMTTTVTAILGKVTAAKHIGFYLVDIKVRS
jgi:hypothetical protein